MYVWKGMNINAFYLLFRDLMLGNQEKKSEIIFYLSRYRLREMRFPVAGL